MTMSSPSDEAVAKSESYTLNETEQIVYAVSWSRIAISTRFAFTLRIPTDESSQPKAICELFDEKHKSVTDIPLGQSSMT